MNIVKKLSLQDHPWLRASPLVTLLNLLNSDGQNARMVGGCVRDALLGREIMDIDIACSLAPEDAMTRLEKAGVKVIPTGLKHGTITAVIEKASFEVTTLRRDVQTDGRHADVAFTDDWLIDAERRDFTFNALYLDRDGSLYDPCDGLRDVAARRVRFIGDPDQRIEEDALRILRFFRFAAQFGQGELDIKGLEACINNKRLIENLSGERLAQEFFKILKAENLLPIIKLMHEKGILAKIIPKSENLQNLTGYVHLEESLGRCNILARLSNLLPKDSDAADDISRHLKLSSKQAKILKNYTAHDIGLRADMAQKDIRRSIYLSGRDIFIFALLQYWARANQDVNHEGWRKILAYAENWPIPTFPVQGKDLMARGLKSGRAMGEQLRALEQEWVQSDFQLTREDMLGKITL